MSWTLTRYGFLAIRDMTDGDIPVGQCPDDAIALANRQETDIKRPHFFRSLFDTEVAVDAFHIAAHDFTDFHDPGPPKCIDAVYLYMEHNLLKKHWYGIFNELRERWPDLTQSDLDYICGDQNKLTADVQKRRHISLEEARRDVDEFVNTLDVHQRLV